MKIAFLSDIHCGTPGVTPGLVERSLALAAAERPDVLCFGGDLLTGWSGMDSLDDFLAVAKTLNPPMGMYSVLGNHEFMADVDEIARKLDRSRIRLLRNETVELRRGGNTLSLAGLDNVFNQTLSSVQSEIAKIEQMNCPIVLEHTPDLAPMFGESFNGILLCGHTHGGQIILPIVQQAATASRFGLRYSAGLYPAGGGVMYITRGVGAVVLPVRIGCPPEVTILELQGPRETSA